VRLDAGNGQREAQTLVCPDGNVQLNGNAAAILCLCDGSRNCDQIVAEITQQLGPRALASDILAFLDEARARGWIVESMLKK
jgi:pyrroloquinoline quinone biosynthesis protein D